MGFIVPSLWHLKTMKTEERYLTGGLASAWNGATLDTRREGSGTRSILTHLQTIGKVFMTSNKLVAVALGT